MSEKATIISVLIVLIVLCGLGCFFFIRKEKAYEERSDYSASHARLYRIGIVPFGALSFVALLFLIEYLISQSSLPVYYQDKIFYYLPRVIYGAIIVIGVATLVVVLAPVIRDKANDSQNHIKFIQKELANHPNAKVYKQSRKVLIKSLAFFWLVMLCLQVLSVVILKTDKELLLGLALTLVGTAIICYACAIYKNLPVLIEDEGFYAWNDGRLQWFPYADVVFAEAKKGVFKGIILHCGSSGEAHVTTLYEHSGELFRELMKRLQNANPKVNISKDMSDFLKKAK